MLQPGLPALVLAARILPGSPALAHHPWRHAEETPSTSRVLFNQRLVIYTFFLCVSILLHPQYSALKVLLNSARLPYVSLVLEPDVFIYFVFTVLYNTE